MAIPLKDKLPPFFTLADGMRLVITALDATTGATVSGVTISQVSIDVDPGGADATTAAEYFPTGPLLVPAEDAA